MATDNGREIMLVAGVKPTDGKTSSSTVGSRSSAHNSKDSVGSVKTSALEMSRKSTMATDSKAAEGSGKTLSRDASKEQLNETDESGVVRRSPSGVNRDKSSSMNDVKQQLISTPMSVSGPLMRYTFAYLKNLTNLSIIMTVTIIIIIITTTSSMLSIVQISPLSMISMKDM